MNDQPTIAQLLLIAAADLKPTFGLNDLAMRAWRNQPDKFGLCGYESQSCDPNKVAYTVMGEKGLVRRGYLDKVGQKLYALTTRGREEAERAKGGEARSLPVVRLDRAREDLLSRLLLSRALLRYRSGQRDTVNRTDAAAFWHRGTADDVDALVDAARQAAHRHGVELRTGRVVSQAELDELGRANAWLRKRFGSLVRAWEDEQ